MADFEPTGIQWENRGLPNVYRDLEKTDKLLLKIGVDLDKTSVKGQTFAATMRRVARETQAAMAAAAAATRQASTQSSAAKQAEAAANKASANAKKADAQATASNTQAAQANAAAANRAAQAAQSGASATRSSTQAKRENTEATRQQTLAEQAFAKFTQSNAAKRADLQNKQNQEQKRIADERARDREELFKRRQEIENRAAQATDRAAAARQKRAQNITRQQLADFDKRTQNRLKAVESRHQNELRSFDNATKQRQGILQRSAEQSRRTDKENLNIAEKNYARHQDRLLKITRERYAKREALVKQRREVEQRQAARSPERLAASQRVTARQLDEFDARTPGAIRREQQAVLRDISQAEKDLAQARRNVSHASENAAKSERDVSRARQSVREQSRLVKEEEQRLTASRDRLTASTKRLTDLERSRNKLQRDLQTGRRELSQADQAAGRVAADPNATNQQRTAALERLARARQKVEESTTRLSQVEGRIAALRQRGRGLVQEVAQGENRLRDSRGRHERAVNGLNRQLQRNNEILQRADVKTMPAYQRELKEIADLYVRLGKAARQGRIEAADAHNVFERAAIRRARPIGNTATNFGTATTDVSGRGITQASARRLAEQQIQAGLARNPRGDPRQIARDISVRLAQSVGEAEVNTSKLTGRLGNLRKHLNDTSEGFFKLSRASGGYYTNIGRVSQGVSELTAGFAGATAGISPFIIAVGAAAAAVGGILLLGKRGAAQQGLIDAFARTGVSLEKLSAAAKGTISELELMRLTNIALTGTTGKLRSELVEKLPKLLEVAKSQARDTGQNVQFLFESLVTGIKRSSPLLIDNTGLLVKRGIANEKLAEELGKSTEELTKQEETLALLNATLAAGQPALEQNADAQATNADKIAAIGAKLSNILDELAGDAQPIFGVILDLVDDLVDGLNGVLTPVGDVLNAVGLVVQDVVTKVGQFLAPVLQPVGQIISSIYDFVSNAGQQMLLGFGRVIGSFIGAFQATIGAAYAPIKGVLDQIARLLIGQSPPPEGPLKDIDEGGRRTAQAWIDGFLNVKLEPVHVVAQRVNKALGAIASFSLEQIETRLKQLDSAVQPFIDQLDIVKARFEQIAGTADDGIEAIDRRIDKMLQAIVDGDAHAAAVARNLDQHRETLVKHLDTQQAIVDQATVQLELMKAQQGEERVLLNIRKRAFENEEAITKEQAKQRKEAAARKEREKKPAAGGQVDVPTAQDLETTALPTGELSDASFSGVDEFFLNFNRAVQEGFATAGGPPTEDPTGSNTWQGALRQSLGDYQEAYRNELRRLEAEGIDPVRSQEFVANAARTEFDAAIRLAYRLNPTGAKDVNEALRYFGDDAELIKNFLDRFDNRYELTPEQQDNVLVDVFQDPNFRRLARQRAGFFDSLAGDETVLNTVARRMNFNNPNLEKALGIYDASTPTGRVESYFYNSVAAQLEGTDPAAAAVIRGDIATPGDFVSPTGTTGLVTDGTGSLADSFNQAAMTATAALDTIKTKAEELPAAVKEAADGVKDPDTGLPNPFAEAARQAAQEVKDRLVETSPITKGPLAGLTYKEIGRRAGSGIAGGFLEGFLGGSGSDALQDSAESILQGSSGGGIETALSSLSANIPTWLGDIKAPLTENLVKPFRDALIDILGLFQTSTYVAAGGGGLDSALGSLSANIPTWLGDIKAPLTENLVKPFRDALIDILGLFQTSTYVAAGGGGLDSALGSLSVNIPTWLGNIKAPLTENLVKPFEDSVIDITGFFLTRLNDSGAAAGLNSILAALSVNIPTWLGDIKTPLTENLVKPFEDSVIDITGFFLTRLDSSTAAVGLNSILSSLAVNIPTWLGDIKTPLTDSLVTPVKEVMDDHISYWVSRSRDEDEGGFASSLNRFFTGSEETTGTLPHMLKYAVDLFAGFPDRIVGALKGWGEKFWNALAVPVVSVINHVIDLVNTHFIDGLNQTLTRSLPGIGPIAGLLGINVEIFGHLSKLPTELPDFLGAAAGGIFGPGTLLVGERGPELITAAQQIAVLPNDITSRIMTQPPPQIFNSGYAAGGSYHAENNYDYSMQNNFQVRNGQGVIHRLRMQQGFRRYR